MSAPASCHVCAAPELRAIPEFQSLMRVRSDTQPWPRGGHLAQCPRCGVIQKPVDDTWRSEIEAIYRDYTIYFPADGREQSVFTPGGQAESRSSRLADRLIARGLSTSGRALDIGCGNGAFLRALSQRLPDWRLAGTEWNDTHKVEVESIPGVDLFCTGAPSASAGRFDLISMIHVLEHIPDPVSWLRSVAGLLEPGGVVFIEVPDAGDNPFDLLIADHASHFTLDTLVPLMRRAGYAVETAATDWVAKELSVIAAPATPESAVAAGAVLPNVAQDGVRWLTEVKRAAAEARRETRPGLFGLFGTSNAATWLASELGPGTVDLFVDEDPGRAGHTFMGRQILLPGDVEPGATVFVGLSPRLATRLGERLVQSRPDVRWLLPPVLPEPG